VLYALLAIVIVAPFERPLLTIFGGFTLTTVEAVFIAASAVIAVHLGPRRLLTGGPTPLTITGGLFLLALAVAALTSPADRGNALRFVARMFAAAALFVLTLRVIATRRDARIVAGAMLSVATAVAAIAVLESAQIPAVLSGLTAFRPGFHVVGGQLRATSTLIYPTIASMYLEVAFALGLWLLLDRSGERTRLTRWLTFAALVIVSAGIAATFTRAGLIAMAVVIVMIAAVRLTRAPRAHAGVGTLTALAGTIVVVVLVSHAPELLATRLTTDGTQGWYGARYEVPPTLALETGQLHRVPIRLSNTGRLSWDSSKAPAFAVAYHWVRAGSDQVVQFDGARTPFPTIVGPGHSIALDADVIAPAEPGSYTLVWDLVHETRAWFSAEGAAPARTHVTVTGSAVAVVATTPRKLPSPIVTPARPALWSAAFAMAGDHPWLGVGPDNYRHNYGPYLRLREWDHRVHANNMYLETLAGAGIIGFTSLVGLIAIAGVQLWSRVRQARDQVHLATLVALTGWLVVAGHGLVDSFLSFTPTYVTFAIAAGVAFSPGLIRPFADARGKGTDFDAHRV
jgi:hypothetical protein